MSNTTETTRYDWSKIPNGYNWAATDFGGDIWAFQSQPRKGSGYFIDIEPNTVPIRIEISYKKCYDWENSLERRPQPQTT